MGSAEKHALTQAVKAYAHRLGFALAGVARPNPPAHLDVFADWLQNGRHGTMDYLANERAIERRRDPRQILPEVQSILVLAVPYHPPGPLPKRAADLQFGAAAAYAWGADYHEVLPERLQALVSFLEAQVGESIPNRYYTDTGPILERELAQSAGLGWIGKNTCLINPTRGSYFFLAEIFLGIELEFDPAMTADHCGSCTRCISACPTGCILPNRTLDATRCIAYLTIEQKGAIPIDLRLQIGQWVFGCDVCQQVCPWNLRFARSPGDPAFAGSTSAQKPDLIKTLALSAETFNRQYKNSPIRRAKRRGLLRNAAVVLGNQAKDTRDERAAEALCVALHDSEPLVRGHAAWALAQVGGPAARQALQQAAESELDEWVRTEIQTALTGVQ